MSRLNRFYAISKNFVGKIDQHKGGIVTTDGGVA